MGVTKCPTQACTIPIRHIIYDVSLTNDQLKYL